MVSLETIDQLLGLDTVIPAAAEAVDTIAGCYPAAYFDRYDWPHMPGSPLST